MTGTSQTEKKLICNWSKNGTFFNENLTKFHFFCQHSQPLRNAIENQIENVEFVQGTKCEFIDLLENGTK